jgi:hypothetical protein
LIENEEEAKIRRACFVLRAYLTPEAEDDWEPVPCGCRILWLR